MKEGPLVQMLDQRVQQAAADEAKKLVDAAALAAERLVDNLEQSYRTRTFAREILFVMSEEVRSGIREDFMKSRFFGHALDEATAKTKNQHVIQYISYWRRGRVLRMFFQ
jgi:hypothetical protein